MPATTSGARFFLSRPASAGLVLAEEFYPVGVGRDAAKNKESMVLATYPNLGAPDIGRSMTKLAYCCFAVLSVLFGQRISFYECVLRRSERQPLHNEQTSALFSEWRQGKDSSCKLGDGFSRDRKQ